jgi:hypothetical protein
MTAPNVRQRWRDAIRDSDDVAIDGLARAVAFALDRHMAADGRTHTGGRLLAQLAGTSSLHVVQDRVNRLIAAGLLTREWAGRGHKAYYQAVIQDTEVTRPTRHSEVTTPTRHPEKVTRLRDEVTRQDTKSDAPHASDPLYPDDPEGRRGGGGELKLPAASAPPLEAAGGAAKGQTTAPRGEHQRWMVDVLSELGWDPDDVDLHDQRLIDAATPLLDRTPVEIRNAVGRGGVRPLV